MRRSTVVSRESTHGSQLYAIARWVLQLSVIAYWGSMRCEGKGRHSHGRHDASRKVDALPTHFRVDVTRESSKGLWIVELWKTLSRIPF